MFKLNVHSIVDVITNSSTIIYTYQNNVKEAKALLQEVLSLLGEEREVDDLFYIGTFLADNDYYCDHLSDLVGEEGYPKDYPAGDWKEQSNYIERLKEKILKNELPKPEWMITIENTQDYDGYTNGTSLHIIPKDEKYSGLIDKMMSFLNSPSHEAVYNG